ncbi:hypothetical protein [Burkholderia pseudomallei]|uniref:hypothetical protein n=1 Tax=Burkholderia pseudomallei TaxID=28450 RepID=UPI001AD6477D|nr:hypothetical protein [Burkholderia pseudomallei]MBO7806121.1 hypothetical protein [Burkholderia pseudomallei]
MRITRAYCVDLDEIVTIDAARREFLSIEPTPERFRFLCSDDACREAGVAVTGVNYTFNAEEGAKHVAAHFRAHNPEKHLPDCEWRKAAKGDASDEPLPGETDEDARQRIARRKLTDFVLSFDPTDREDVDGKSRSGKGSDGDNDGAGSDGHPRPTRPRAEGPAGGHASTRDLERLAESYRDARATLSDDEFRVLTLRVKKIGTLALGEYFQPLTRCSEATADRIIYGGATLSDRYPKDGGRGFKLKFYDKIDNLPVYLYVSQADVDAYRHRKYLCGIVDKIPAHRFVRVFANGVIRRSPSGKSYSVEISHPRHLALVLAEPKDNGKASAKE